ncbi:MAG: type II toxin-antitoxin system Phd/YefM family antitoxin [Deltaproteobacteria bacterium]|nr:type II toxin-antitoxin system Phd/YefM family antitoxin [Deltaproteobacteria bacterium]MBM4323250.1 type II toxin-antitoxin system Phd/YefM family antitoxin [Deltaproteobacteria bacterium]
MALKVNVHEAKTHFSRILTRVGDGEEVVISKAGKPIARLVPIAGKQAQRTPGSAKGKIVLEKDFDAPLPDFILKGFEK